MTKLYYIVTVGADALTPHNTLHRQGHLFSPNQVAILWKERERMRERDREGDDDEKEDERE